MGVTFSFLRFFDIVYKQNAFCDPVVALGSLNINESDDDIREFASKNQWWKQDDTNSVRNLFRDRYNILDYKDIDINGVADIRLDLNKPVDSSYHNSVNVVLNGGTLEHVFDIAQALKNIHGMLKQGGSIIHLLPVSWYNHGYYNFNPFLFKEISRVNNYQLLAEAFYCNPNILTYVAQGMPVNYDKQDAPAITYITFDGEYTEENERISNSFNKAVFPSNLLYMVAYKKNNSNEFVYPVDCQL
jgi:SAM-dependent methyltransferase